MNDDSSLIQRFLSGDQKGFEMLVRKYQDKVLNIIYSLIGKDRESEDIAQEVFLKAYHNLKSFRQESSFLTWLYRITVNTAYDFLRKRKLTVSDDLALESAVSPARSPIEELSLKEREALVQQFLASVPVKFRAAMVLKDIEGLNYAEIGRILGCGLGTVESKIFRGRQILKEKMRKLSGELR